MPSFASSSEVRDSTDGTLLVLRARHVLVSGVPSETVRTVKGRLPDDLDVILQSDLVIALTGMVNRVNICSRAIQCSAIANHLLNYFHMNGEQLGVRPASKVYIDDSDGMAKPDADLATAADPFSPHAFLPLIAALDRAVERFVGLHLIRRYPLIFGPWRERYDAEVALTEKIARAVVNITARSPNAQFRKRSRNLMKVADTLFGQHMRVRLKSVIPQALRLNCAAVSVASEEALRGVLRSVGESNEPELPVLCHSMERLFKHGLKPIRYKSVTSFSGTNGADRKTSDGDDELALLSEPRSDSPPVLERLGAKGSEKFTALGILDVDLDLELNLDLDAQDRAELCFDEDEDAETLSGSQEQVEDLFFSDDGFLSDDTDLMAVGAQDKEPGVIQIRPGGTIHIAVAEDFDFDDLWASSQETLDDGPSQWEGERSMGSSQLSTSSGACSFSDSYPRTESPGIFMVDDEDECMLDHDSNEGEDEDGGWPGDLADADDLEGRDGDLLSPGANPVFPASPLSHWEHQVSTNSRHVLSAGVGLPLGYSAGLGHSLEEGTELLHFDPSYGSEPNAEPLGQAEARMCPPPTLALAPARCTEHAGGDVDADEAALRRFPGAHSELKGDIVAGEPVRLLEIRSPDGDDQLPSAFSAYSWR
ncbi:hypothetical protein ONZ51_g293 [Trametes cubensis]|uniref:Uncharacterized protein n=1 Tax=Trametes cubensis TaxID=1111947 RepID=A0AAD7U621_9APHY|nr:hypothetical protein ONZ51_g293 [Trametes cubensis]